MKIYGYTNLEILRKNSFNLEVLFLKDKIFAVLQRVGRSFMLPIALLPVAGLLLGIGASFTNPTTLATYGLDAFIYEGSILYGIFEIMSKTGSVVFDNLALLFAMGVAIGMAEREKEVAALSGAIAYLIMNTAISTLINLNGGVEALPANTTTQVLGITTLQTGVFGGIIVGLGVAYLHNRFYKIQLPQVLSFFGGTRFVPIISSLVYLLVGILLYFVWPMVQTGIAALGQLVLNSGYIGTWIYGIIERALIPFGLHHVFYMPFWQTELGGAMVIDGVTVQGAQNIFFAQLASKSTEVFSVEATRFMSGKFPFMIFGLPAAAFAMYRAADTKRKKVVGGLLLSAALTAMLTGITEPIEFTFLFVAPLLYAIHCVLAGLSYMLMHILGVGVGMTFSGGVIDLTLFGILQGNEKTNWIWIVIVGLAYAAVYYFLFYFLIKKLDLKTPGRDLEAEVKLYTREDYNKKGKKDDSRSALILEGLGGINNIANLDCCATRLRVTVKNPALVQQTILKGSGASGVIQKGDGVQVIYGPIVSNIKSELELFMDSGAHEQEAENNAKTETLYSYMTGEIVPLKDVPDEVFSTKVLGDGIAIKPKDYRLVAPSDGEVVSLTDTLHAINIKTTNGTEILLHIGIDTVNLKGEFFHANVKNGDKFKKGDLLIYFDGDKIKEKGYSLITPMIIIEKEKLKLTHKGDMIKQGESLIEIED